MNLTEIISIKWLDLLPLEKVGVISIFVLVETFLILYFCYRVLNNHNKKDK